MKNGKPYYYSSIFLMEKLNCWLIIEDCLTVSVHFLLIN